MIGYSINDSVVVFDRIRELRRSRARDPLDEVANDACLQTVPRTINTGLGALFILSVLYVLGGDTLTDFALALLVGILVGTWSSVFTATPLLVLLERGRSPAGKMPGSAPDRSPANVLVPAGRRPEVKRPTTATMTGRRRLSLRATKRPSPPRPRKRKGGKRR